MSKTIEVTYGVSIMMGEHWQKISVKQLPDEGETMETVLDEVCERVKSWHKNKYPSMYPQDKVNSSIKNSIKMEPDIIILKKYDNAIKSGDEKTKKEIEENYNII